MTEASETSRLSVQHADALWDAVAIPGPQQPTFTEQHERVCKAVADILDETTPADPADMRPTATPTTPVAVTEYGLHAADEPLVYSIGATTLAAAEAAAAEHGMRLVQRMVTTTPWKGSAAASVPADAREESRQRVAAALREHYLSSSRGEADADGNLPCRCGDWREPGAEADDENDWDSHLADAVLAELPAPADLAAELDRLRTENERMRHELEVMYGGAFDTLKDAADHPALRHLLAQALARHDAVHARYSHGFANRYGVDPETDGFVDAVTAVMGAPADRGAVLREAADAVAELIADGEHDPDCLVAELRRMAAEARGAQQDGLPFVRRVLEIFSASHADAYGDLLWHVDDNGVHLSVDVSDVFAWGGADCEPITPETLPALEQDYLDLKAVDGEDFLAPLYAARQRHQRPQGAAYPSGTHKAWQEVSALYDACGPERELGLGNPKHAPAHRAAAPQHTGGNAEDCPACQQQGIDTISYPWECPGNNEQQPKEARP